MFCGPKIWHWAQCVCRRPGLLVTLVLIVIVTTPYLIFETSLRLVGDQKISSKYYGEFEEKGKNYLVWNPKCQILRRDPLDPSIRRFVRKEKFEPCSRTPLLTRIVRGPDNQQILKVDQKLAKKYPDLSCSWAPISRSKPTEHPNLKIDSEVSLGPFLDLKDEAILPEDVEVTLVKCKGKNSKFKTRGGQRMIYENVHAIIRVEKVEDRNKPSKVGKRKKLSVLFLGLDNVSRLNFERSMPRTTRHLRSTGWIELRGYNKMADNTFPNLMAMLTGMNNSRAWDICKPNQYSGLDNCPFIWQAFRDAGYVTGYGEDAVEISTFNYMKMGFANSPTDFYLRPYMIAAEKYLEPKRHLNTSYYCTGPEPSGSRILNYAVDFAKTFLGVPYFGFFWTNTMSHDNVNGPSSVDEYIVSVIERLDREGILNDSMVFFISDHGLRFGLMRETLQGWYEEKLPFSHVSLPEWFKEENPDSFEALKENGRSLTSPFNVYETLGEIVNIAGGHAEQSEGCPKCKSLFSHPPVERGCEDVGVTEHWCACTTFSDRNISEEVALEAARKMVERIDGIIQQYTDSKGKRLCAKLRVKRVITVEGIVESLPKEGDYRQFLCQVQVAPGDGKFEATMREYEDGNVTIVGGEVSRINTYKGSGKCLKVVNQQYCFCNK